MSTATCPPSTDFIRPKQTCELHQRPVSTPMQHVHTEEVTTTRANDYRERDSRTRPGRLSVLPNTKLAGARTRKATPMAANDVTHHFVPSDDRQEAVDSTGSRFRRRFVANLLNCPHGDHGTTSLPGVTRGARPRARPQRGPQLPRPYARGRTVVAALLFPARSHRADTRAAVVQPPGTEGLPAAGSAEVP